MARYATLDDNDRSALKSLTWGALGDNMFQDQDALKRIAGYGLVVRGDDELNRLTEAGRVACVALGYLKEETEMPF